MKNFKATKEEQDFFREFVPGHTYKEIQAEFCKRFNKPITLNQVTGYLKRNGLKTGTDGRFKKGQTPHNKGIKGWYAQGMERNWFKKGNIPQKYKPVGSERISKDGYIEIKVKDPNKWQLKHRYVWEKENGEIQKGMLLIFKDNNKLNIDLDNLMLISKAENAVINRAGDSVFTGQTKEVIVNLARLKCATGKAKKGVDE
nr:MAG TPA: homing endonuclease [Caudoviricetes sp.]